MGMFCKNYEAEEAGGQLTLKTAINQKRIIVVKLPYSDMKTLPPQVRSFYSEDQAEDLSFLQLPLKVIIYSTISVPLETKQLIRHIQRAEQLTVSINLKVYFEMVLKKKTSCQ